MIYSLILLLFFIFSYLIFFLDNIYFLSISLFISILYYFYLTKNISKSFSSLKKSIIFILFIFICNFLFLSLNDALLLSLKLLTLLLVTFIISKIFTPSKFTNAFYYLLYPLKIFKININDLALIITITLNFIPILIDEAKAIKLSLLSKGFKFNLQNCLLKPHIYLITYLNNVFERVDELEKSLAMKAYE